VINPLYSALLGMHLDYCVLFGASQHKTEGNKLEQVQQRAFVMARDWNTFPVKRGKVSWGCSAWRRDTLRGRRWEEPTAKNSPRGQSGCPGRLCSLSPSLEGL